MKLSKILGIISLINSLDSFADSTATAKILFKLQVIPEPTAPSKAVIVAARITKAFSMPVYAITDAVIGNIQTIGTYNIRTSTGSSRSSQGSGDNSSGSSSTSSQGSGDNENGSSSTSSKDKENSGSSTSSQSEVDNRSSFGNPLKSKVSQLEIQDFQKLARTLYVADSRFVYKSPVNKKEGGVRSEPSKLTLESTQETEMSIYISDITPGYTRDKDKVELINFVCKYPEMSASRCDGLENQYDIYKPQAIADLEIGMSLVLTKEPKTSGPITGLSYVVNIIYE